MTRRFDWSVMSARIVTTRRSAAIPRRLAALVTFVFAVFARRWPLVFAAVRRRRFAMVSSTRGPPRNRENYTTNTPPLLLSAGRRTIIWPLRHDRTTIDMLTCCRLLMAAALVIAHASSARAQSNQPPIGSIESIDLRGIVRGWAMDPDSTDPVYVHFYVDGAPGTGGTFFRAVRANAPSLGHPVLLPGGPSSAPVGNEFALPLPVRDGLPHTLYAYAIDANDPSLNQMLAGSGAAFTVPPAIRSITNGTIQVGIDDRCGGVLAELRINGSANVVNNADCGRQVQAALYDGDAVYDACAGCTGVFGWNAVQGGDMYNFGSPSAPLPQGAGDLSAQTNSLQWNPDDKTGYQGLPVTSDVQIEQQISLLPGHPSVVRVQYTLIHTGTDRHSNAWQELPAVYLNAEFNRVAYYAGAAPWTGGAVTVAPLDVWPAPIRRYRASELWSALVNAGGEAVAFYYPGQYPYFMALSYGGVSAGTYGQSANYMVPFTTLSLAPNTTYDIEFFVVAGTVTSARDVIYSLQHTAVDAAGPTGAVDTPSNGAVLTGSVQVSGWSFDNRAIDRIDVLVDGQFAGTAKLGFQRPDVQVEYPGAPANTGYRFTLN